MLYFVSYSDWDDFCPTLVEGPEVDNWKNFCDSLIPDAIELLLRQNLNNSYIGTNNIVDCIVKLLITKGYAVIEPINANYNGDRIIRDNSDFDFEVSDESLKSISNINSKIDELWSNKNV